MVMWQQTARYLMKIMDELEVAQPQTMSLPSGVAYLANVPTHAPLSPADVRSLNDLLRLSGMRALSLVEAAHTAIQKTTSAGSPKSRAWNAHMLLLIRAAHAHISHFVLSSFISSLSSVADPQVRIVLSQLCHLFALASLFPQLPTSNPTSTSLGIGFDAASRSALDAGAAHQINELLDALIPNAIALTDAWDFSDASLASALGSRDGNVYERLMTWTRQLPISVRAGLNGGVDSNWNRYVRPALRFGLQDGVAEAVRAKL